MGTMLLRRELAIDEFLLDARDQIRDAPHSGQVPTVTYVVTAGSTVVGLLLGTLATRSPDVGGGEEVLVPSLLFTYHSASWMALATPTAGTGRLLDKPVGSERVSASYTDLSFGVVAIRPVVREFAGSSLERQGELTNLELPG